VVRLVNSGFGAGEEWDADYDGMSTGWRIFLENLRLHLVHFRGRPARAVIPTAITPGPGEVAWSRLCAALGVATSLAVGDRVEATGTDAPRLGGRVEGVSLTPAVRTYHLLLDEPAPGTAFVTVEGDAEEAGVPGFAGCFGAAGFVDELVVLFRPASRVGAPVPPTVALPTVALPTAAEARAGPPEL
jgi:hypothetical protein